MLNHIHPHRHTHTLTQYTIQYTFSFLINILIQMPNISCFFFCLFVLFSYGVDQLSKLFPTWLDKHFNPKPATFWGITETQSLQNIHNIFLKVKIKLKKAFYNS